MFSQKEEEKRSVIFWGREMEVLVGVEEGGQGVRGWDMLAGAKGWVWGIDIGIDQPYADIVTTGQR